MRKDCFGNLSSRVLGDDSFGQLLFLDCFGTIETSTSRTCLLFGVPVSSHCFAPLPILAKVQDKIAQSVVVGDPCSFLGGMAGVQPPYKTSVRYYTNPAKATNTFFTYCVQRTAVQQYSS